MNMWVIFNVFQSLTKYIFYIFIKNTNNRNVFYTIDISMQRNMHQCTASLYLIF